jgi:quinoprotein glucose dehydrogenase
MNASRIWFAPLAVVSLAVVLSSRTIGGQQPAATAAQEWRTYGHDPGGMRFSPLTQITAANVDRLSVAWVYHMKPPVTTPPPAAEAVAPPTGRGRGRGRGGAGFFAGETTPLVIDGVMFVSTPYGRVVALDPTDGKELWVFEIPAGGQPSTRGVEYWAGDPSLPPQIVFGTGDGRLISLHAKTGEPNEKFGDKGFVNLNTPEILQGSTGNNGLSSPPVIYRNLVITGGRTQESPAQGPAGDVRAWDMHTGKLVWTFHSIPRASEKYNDTWAADSWKNRSGVNVWGLMTVDVQRGIVYMPFGAPATDRYGGDRPGDNLFSSSVVAADARTGKYLWHFQVVHHDIWDADVSNPPLLFDVRQNGRTIPAVAVMSKSGLLFLLDRVNGKPIYGVEQRPVPQSEVPLERTAKTQPFPVKPPPLSRMTMTAADVATVTPELEAACRKLMEGMQLGGPYLPVGFNRLRVQFPGNHGGVNWGGASFNPELGYMFINTSELGQVQGFAERVPNPGAAEAAGARSGRGSNSRYRDLPGGGRFKDVESNMMCQQPPWGQLTAVNVNTGEFAWRSVLGVTDSLPPEKQKTGRPGNGGSIATAGGLVFVGATDDSRFRAFDARTGQELWTVKLGAAAHAVPSTYLGKDGRQYVVITSTGGGFLEAPVTDDSITAFALPGSK